MVDLALINAVKSNNLDEVKDILASEIDINAIDGDGNPALFYAVKNRNYDIMKELLNSSTDITLIDKIFDDVFENDDVKAYMLLLDYNSEDTLSYNDGLGDTVVYCIDNNKVGILDATLTRYYYIVNEIIDGIKPPLMFAAEVNASLDVGRVLLKHGSDPNESDDDHQHILTAGNLKWIKFLVENGSDVNYRLFGNNTPFHDLIFYGDEIVDYLLDQGANPTKRNNWGATPLHRAISTISPGILDRILDEYGSTFFDEPDEEGQTALHHLVSIEYVPRDWRASINNISIKLHMLFFHRTDFTVLNSDGYNPLEFVENQFDVNAYTAPWADDMKRTLMNILKELMDPSLALLSQRTIVENKIDISSLSPIMSIPSTFQLLS